MINLRYKSILINSHTWSNLRAEFIYTFRVCIITISLKPRRNDSCFHVFACVLLYSCVVRRADSSNSKGDEPCRSTTKAIGVASSSWKKVNDPPRHQHRESKHIHYNIASYITRQQKTRRMPFFVNLVSRNPSLKIYAKPGDRVN